MGKVTYLIGAGASRNALPLVNDIPAELRLFGGEIGRLLPNGVGSIGNRSEGATRSLIEGYQNAIMEVADNSGPSSTVDTYGKQLSISKESVKYLQLKAVLSSFFNFKQFRDPGDPRYDTFLASVLGENSMDFKGSINVISWNYDFQFEKAYSRYLNAGTRIPILQNGLQIYPNVKSSSHNFRIFRINGSVGYKLNSEPARFIVDYFEADPDHEKLAKRAVTLFSQIETGDAVSDILFSFDYKGKIENNEILKSANYYISESEAIVIIGYSFPFFNRDTDRAIIDKILNKHLKIYIQDPDPDTIEDSLMSIAPKVSANQIKKIRSCKQFFLPPEL